MILELCRSRYYGHRHSEVLASGYPKQKVSTYIWYIYKFFYKLDTKFLFCEKCLNYSFPQVRKRSRTMPTPFS